MNNDFALLIIDMQVGMFAETDPIYEENVLLERIQGLIAKARTCGVPVVYVQHNAGVGNPLEPNTTGWNIHPAIAPVQEDVIIQKTTPDAFYETKLQLELETKGIRKLVLTGIQTELCVDTTCRRAFSLGYDVIVAKDAHSTSNRGKLTATQIIDHHNDLLRWFADTEESINIVFNIT